MSESGNKCMLSLIENTPCPKYIPKICEELFSKNSQMRTRCSFYLFKILSSYPKIHLEKYLTIIESSIILSVNDANKETRINGRLAFNSFRELFSNKADKMFQRFDTITQKYIHEEFNNSNHHNSSNTYNQEQSNNSSFSIKIASKGTPNDKNKSKNDKPKTEINESLKNTPIKKNIANFSFNNHRVFNSSLGQNQIEELFSYNNLKNEKKEEENDFINMKSLCLPPKVGKGIKSNNDISSDIKNHYISKTKEKKNKQQKIASCQEILNNSSKSIERSYIYKFFLPN